MTWKCSICGTGARVCDLLLLHECLQFALPSHLFFRWEWPIRIENQHVMLHMTFCRCF